MRRVATILVGLVIGAGAILVGLDMSAGAHAPRDASATLPATSTPADSTSAASTSAASLTRISQPMELASGETLYPVDSNYVAGVTATEAAKSVPLPVQPVSIYLGSLKSSKFTGSSDTPVYVFRFDNYCLPSNGSRPGVDMSHICDAGAIIDVQVNADTGAYIALSQVTNPIPSQSSPSA